MGFLFACARADSQQGTPGLNGGPRPGQRRELAGWGSTKMSLRWSWAEGFEGRAFYQDVAPMELGKALYVARAPRYASTGR